MMYFVLILIFACANDLFYLVPGYHIKGVFNVNDIGNLILWVAVLYYIFNTNRYKLLFNKVSLLILLYLFLILIHVAIATVNYDQSILSGLIKSRHQFYYFSYFLFLMALDTDEKAERFMKILAYVGVFVLIVSVINYSGITLIREHKWAQGHGERSGITRAFIPAMNLIVMMYIWYMSQIVYNNKFISREGGGALIFFMGILFRQTRGRTIMAIAATVWALMRTGRVKIAAALIILGAIIGITLGTLGNENILVNTFTTAYSNVTEEEGSWRGRSQTLQHSIDTFLEDPILGSGALLLRKTGDFSPGMQYRADAYQADLGWAHWLKNFGIAGIVWYLSLVLVLWGYIRKQRSSGQDSKLTRFGEFQFVNVSLSMATINYFVKPEGIIVFCLALAMITRPWISESANTKVESKSVPPNLLR